MNKPPFRAFCGGSSRDSQYSPIILTTSSLHVLANLHGGGDISNPTVLAEYKEIEDALRFEREQAVHSIKALTEPRMFKRVILGMSIQMWSQLCGMIYLEISEID